MDTAVGSRDFLARLLGYRQKERRLVLGLNADAAARGVDVALVEIGGPDPRPDWRVLGVGTTPYTRALRHRIGNAGKLVGSDLRALERDIGRCFAEAAHAAAARSRHSPTDVDLIGAQGQCILEPPRFRGRVASAFQLGDPDALADVCDCPVLSDFGRRDIAAGGAGTPLLPMIDALLFHKPGEARALVHVGDVATVTFLPPGPEAPTALEIGPGMLLIDAVRRRAQPDAGDDLDLDPAAEGYVLEDLLAHLLQHPFLEPATDRPAGHEHAAETFARRLLREHGHASIDDLLATLAVACARSIGRSVLETGPALMRPPDRVYVSGRGARSSVLMRSLTDVLPAGIVHTTTELGIAPEAKEAFSFAVLAHHTAMGRLGNYPPATGARRSVPLGRLTL